MTKAISLPCSTNPDDWFAWPGSKRANRAKQQCRTCPEFVRCGMTALADGIPEGVFGGLDREDREAIWAGNRPTGFMDAIDAAMGPLLQERRDFEALEDPDITELDQEFDLWSESA